MLRSGLWPLTLQDSLACVYLQLGELVTEEQRDLCRTWRVNGHEVDPACVPMYAQWETIPLQWNYKA